MDVEARSLTTTVEIADWRGARRAARRRRLVEAFCEMAGQVGVTGTGIGQVCRAAGVSTRAFYATFTSKQECFVAGFDARAAPLIARARHAYEQAHGPWEARLSAGLTSIMGDLAADPGYARFCTIEALSAGPEALAHFETVVARCQAIFSDTGTGGPPLPPDEEAFGGMLVGAVLQPMLAYVHEGRTAHLPELVPLLVGFLTRTSAGPVVATPPTHRVAWSPARRSPPGSSASGSPRPPTPG